MRILVSSTALRDAVKDLLVGIDALCLRFSDHMFSKDPELADEQKIAQCLAYQFAARLVCFTRASSSAVLMSSGRLMVMVARIIGDSLKEFSYTANGHKLSF
jgi:hypothetical protein